MRYHDRADAGRVLATALLAYEWPGTIVLGLARGGVIIAVPVAAALGVPMDVLVIRKLGLPWSPEVAFGAVGMDGVEVRDPELAALVGAEQAAYVAESERAEAGRRALAYRPGRSPLDLTGRTALIVDDGFATGATAVAAVEVARHLGAERVIVAAPVGARDSVDVLRSVADDVVCPFQPAAFSAVSHWYARFPQVTDEEVRAALGAA